MIKYLEKLLNGREVEWKKLEEIFNNKTGYTPSKNTKEYWENGTVNWYTIDDINKKGRILTEANIKINAKGVKKDLFESNSIVISVIATIGEYALIKNDFIINQQFLVLSLKNEFKKNINMDFIRCYFSEISQYCKKNIRVGTVPTVDIDNLLNQKIPIPPLDIQEEIVRVLDKLTDHTKELTKELTLRKKEYSYYRDYLLEFKNIDKLGVEVKRIKLSDIAISIFRGNGIKKDEVDINGDIACVRYGEIYTMYNTYFEKCISRTNLSNILNPKYIEKGDLLFAITGESIEDIAKTTVYLGEEKALVGGDILVLRHKQNPKYLSYALSTQDAIKQKMKGKVKSKVVHTNAEDIGNIEIFLPTLEIQERIVNVLDNFEKICNDLNIGLPKEIELRQKEYEYYREYILTNIGNRITLEDKTRQDKTRQDKTI